MKTKKLLFLAAVILVAFVGGWMWAGMDAPAGSEPGVAAVAQGDATKVVMYQNPSCGCCSKWASHMEAAGFEVETIKTDQINDIKRREGIYDPEIASCHTAFIDGYIVEGHVPADDVRRMLRERPDIKGIAAPGMPVGSPGMEVAGQPADSYDVIAFDAEGNTSVFASH